MIGNECARVTPLFKQGDRDDLNNYRPISVISVVAKVFERIVYDQLYAYLEEQDIICKYQPGFRAIHSTVTALLEATDAWAYDIDRGKINAVVFLNFKKDFRHGGPRYPFIKTKPLRYQLYCASMVSIIFRGPGTNMFHQWSPL